MDDHAVRWQRRWVYIADNLVSNARMKHIEGIVDRAHRAGFNGVLFADSKSAYWWKLPQAETWARNAGRLRAFTRERGMELAAYVFQFGYSRQLLWHDPNLAAGLPIRDAPLVATGDRLVPVETAAIPNGSFERFYGNRVDGCILQDGAGRVSFVDPDEKKSGAVSLRFENIGAGPTRGHGRVAYRIAVRPWQQYRLRAWLKAEHLDGGSVRVMVRGNGRTLLWQYLRHHAGDRTKAFRAARNLTTDWIEQLVSFNSLDNTKIEIYVGTWGAERGRIWWDDLRIEAVPTLNVLRRDSLPLTVRSVSGTPYEEGRDFARIADPALGQNYAPGTYDARHVAPPIELLPDSRIAQGETVYLSAYHATIINRDQVTASMSEPRVFEICEEQLRHALRALDPDVVFMAHDEIRVAGWAPAEVRGYETSGDLFADNVRRCRDMVRRHGPDKPVFVWSDMFDPNHNARADYYLVNNTIAGSWKGLDPDNVIVKWGRGPEARASLDFFADRGHRQMIAAFYDSNVAADYQKWQQASRGVPGVMGVMYTTWRRDYSKLEEFAATWWGR